MLLGAAHVSLPLQGIHLCILLQDQLRFLRIVFFIVHVPAWRLLSGGLDQLLVFLFQGAAGVAGERRRRRLRVFTGCRRKSFCLLGDVPNSAEKLSSRRRGQRQEEARTRTRFLLRRMCSSAATDDELQCAAAAVGAPI